MWRLTMASVSHIGLLVLQATASVRRPTYDSRGKNRRYILLQFYYSIILPEIIKIDVGSTKL